MADFSRLIITDEGKALLSKAIQGTGKIKFTKMCTSNEEIEPITELQDVNQISDKLTITYPPDSDTIKIETVFNNKDLTQGYYVNYIGLYAIDAGDSDAQEILYAVVHPNRFRSCYIPEDNGQTVSSFCVQLVTSIGDADVAIEMVEGGVISTQEYLDILDKVDTANAAANTAKTTADASKTTADAAYVAANTAQKAVDDVRISVNNLFYNNAGAHNAIYRGKNLGTGVTAEQYAAIKAGTFDNMYIGDYWVINNVTWRIAAFDYYYNTGNGTTDSGVTIPKCSTHHVTIVPDARLYVAKMNGTATTEGGYVGSQMYTTNLATAKTTINTAFGSSHILSHGQLLCSTVTNGVPTDKGWYESTVELMTEQNVVGARNVGTAGSGAIGIDNKPFPLFAHNPSLIAVDGFWLRDVATASYFVYANSSGFIESGAATYAGGVRPAFSIIG